MSKLKLTKVEKLGLCGGSACAITAIVGTIIVSPVFLAFVPVGFVLVNSCNLRKK